MKIGRNAPCPCGSGKKYKKCCLNKDQQAEIKHPNKNDLSFHDVEQTLHQENSRVQIRPYAIAKMCDPTEKHVQEFLGERPHLKDKKLISVSQFRKLSKKKLIQQLSELGVNYNQDQFVAICEKHESAWDAAEVLWPRQAKSRNKDSADTVCLSARFLWEKLYDEEKITKISVEMLDDWMEDGYKELNKDRSKACRIWFKVWETFKNDYDLANMSIDEIDNQFIGSQSFYNWCQDFEMELINASFDSPECAKLGITYLSEFLNYFADDDEHLVNNFKSALGECYCRSGDQETGEKVSRELIQQYPDKMVGYIAMETALSIGEKNGQTGNREKKLKLLEEAKNYPVIDGEDYDLDRRIAYLKEEIAKFEKKDSIN